MDWNLRICLISSSPLKVRYCMNDEVYSTGSETRKKMYYHNKKMD